MRKTPVAPHLMPVEIASVSAYDAWYVSRAEALAAPLATIDSQPASATGP